MQNFKKLKKIGEGHFSEVFLVEDEHRHKFILKEYKSGFSQEARREYLYLNTFTDTHIVKAEKFFEDENAALLLEYLTGNPLHFSQFSERKQIFSLMSKLCETVSKIHSVGICLNDLKPENIIMQNGEPVILDFGLATLNLYNDGFLRGTVSYAAPEKLFRQTNHFPADVFSLGIIFLFLTNRKTPADDFSAADYKKLLLNRQKWNEYLSDLQTDVFVKKMLAFSPLERPNALSCTNHFAELSEEKLNDLTSLEIKNIIFQNQIEAAEQLLQTKTLNCGIFDEPEKIVNLLSLLSESRNKKLVILSENDFILYPKKFFKTASAAFGKEIKSYEELKRTISAETKVNVLLKREKPHSTFFEDLQKTGKILVLNKTEKSNVRPVSKQELENILANIRLENAAEILRDYHASKPYLIRLQLFDLVSENGKKKVISESNELVAFVSELGIPVPFAFIEKLWKDWKTLLQKAIRNNRLILEGDALRFAGKSTEKVSPELLQKAVDIANKKKFYFAAARISQMQKNRKAALNFYGKHIRNLLKDEYYFSAYETYKILREDFSDAEIPVILKKREAFLNRVCGFPQKALELYSKLEKGFDDLEKAVLSADKAIVLQELGKHRQAIELYEKAQGIFAANGRMKDFLRTKNNLGVVLVEQNRFREAEKVFWDMLKTAEKQKDNQFVTMANLNLADVYLKSGEWKKSLHFARRASELAEKFKKFEIRVYADLYAVQANFALGNIVDLPEIMKRLQAAEKIKENALLQSYLLSVFLFINEFLDEKEAEKIAAKLETGTYDEETKLALFFYYYHRKHFFKTLEMYRVLKDKKLPQTILAANSEQIGVLLNELAETGKIYKYLYFASQLVLSENFRNMENLKKNMHDFLKIYSFSPLENLLSETDKTAVPNHLPVYWEILNRIHGSVEFSKTMKAVLSGILQIGKLERAIYFYYQNGEIKPVIGLDSELMEIDTENIMVSRTILHDTIKMGKLRFLTNLQEDIPFDIHSSIFGLGLRTALCFPLIINNETKGIIYSDARGDKVFSEEEKRVLELILVQARSALEKSDIFENLKRETETIKSNISGVQFAEIIGNSRQMQEIYSLMKTVGEHNVNVLITGPTGSGKELIARALHDEYAKNSPFVVVNCAAIPDQLLESELFGYKKGAFTGAVSDRKGKIELANGGTLFLDEIGDMPLTLQAKLLRVIQERVVTPIGSSKEIHVSIRLIAATNQDLEKLVEDKLFREDLYYRLKVINIKLPPLKERKDDIPLLVHYFIKKFNKKFGKDIIGISSDALHFLQVKEWKGNIRELENEIEKAVLLSDGNTLQLEYLKDAEDEAGFSLFDSIPEKWKDYQSYKSRIGTTLDKNYIKKLLKLAGGNIQKASKLAGISRTQIYRLLNKKE